LIPTVATFLSTLSQLSGWAYSAGRARAGSMPAAANCWKVPGYLTIAAISSVIVAMSIGDVPTLGERVPTATESVTRPL